MSVTLNAAYFATLTGATESAAQIEAAIDTTIDALNVYNLTIPNLSGTPGSKSVTLTSQQRGAIMMLLRNIYVNYVKNPGGISSMGLGNLSMATSELMTNPAVNDMIKRTAYQLHKRTFERTYR